MKLFFETIIVGAGFGGLSAALELGKKNKQVLVIDKANHHLFQPLLYQVASAGLSPADIATPIREILKNYSSISIIMDEVTEILKNENKIETRSGKTIAFNNLIIATGAKHSYFGNDQWEQFAPGLKTIDDAIRIRENILTSFEKSELENNRDENIGYTTFIVIGAGPTGVEMAGAIAEIATKTLAKNFSHINPRDSKIYLIEGGNRVLSSFDPSLSQKAKKDLEFLGVKVMLNCVVKNIDENGVYTNDSFIPSKNIIWAAGNKANPLVEKLNSPRDKANRVIIESDCSLSLHPNIFIIGDAAALKWNNTYLPALAPVAQQQGKYVAKLISRNLVKGKRDTFKYFDKGSMATIGKSKAVAQVGHLKISGFIAWFAWCLVHLLSLVLFRNRVFILIDWIYNYFTEQRGARLIKSQPNKTS